MTGDVNVNDRAVRGRFQTGLVATIAGAHFVHDVFTALLAPLLPLLIEKLAISLFLAGLLAVLVQLPSTLNPLLGVVVDRRHWQRRLFIIGPGASGVLMCLIGVAPSYAVLAVLLLTAGCSVAAVHVSGPVLIHRFAGPSVGKGMSFFMVGGELARTVGPLVAVQAVSMLGLEGLWKLAPVAAVSSLVLAWRLPPVAAPDGRERPLPLLALWRRMRRVFACVIGILMARAFMVGAVVTFLPVYVYGQGHSLWTANISLSVLELGGAAGALAAGTLSDGLGRRRVLLGAVLLAPVLMVLFVVTGGALSLAVLVMLGFTMLSTTPVLLALTMEHSGANPAGAAGTYMMIGFAARSVVTLLVGAAADAWGLRPVYLGCAALAALGLPFVLALPADRRPADPRAPKACEPSSDVV